MNDIKYFILTVVLVQNWASGTTSWVNPLQGLFSDPIQEDKMAVHLRSTRSLNPNLKVSKVKVQESIDDVDLTLKKRETHGPIGYIWTPAYCRRLGYQCGNLQAIDKQLCLLNCANVRHPTQQKYSNYIPNIIMYLCLTVNTFFSVIGGGILFTERYTPKDVVNRFNVDKDDLPEFAKTSANALVVALIKKIASEDINLLKVLIRKLEQHDKKDMNRVVDGDVLALLAEFGSGKYTNKLCETANLNGDSITLSEILKKRQCNMDILMPGYFVFSRAPALVKTPKIKAILRGFSVPLFIFTGVQCCLIPYKETGTVYKCPHSSDLLSEPHGMIDDGPRTVCGSIPDYIPVILRANDTEPLTQDENNNIPIGCEDNNDEEYDLEGDEDPCAAAKAETEAPTEAEYKDSSAEQEIEGRADTDAADIEAAYSDIGDDLLAGIEKELKYS